MRFNVLTVFPELIAHFSEFGLISRALEEEHVTLEATQLRDFAINTHGQIDDTPYGGGSGMVLRADAAAQAIESTRREKSLVVHFTPRGKPFNQEMAKELVASHSDFVLLCSRYEGADERIAENWIDLEISLGDYILMGGESAAMVFIETLTRLLPGVLGNAQSIAEESFENDLLEYPQYTKPQEFRGHSAPPVLLSGDHQAVVNWRREKALQDTAVRRPELLFRTPSTAPLSLALIHYPVTNKEGKIITSSITNLDLHDIARSARTYGIEKFYIVHPVKTLRLLAERIHEHWDTGYGSRYNPNRKEALDTLAIVPEFEDVVMAIEEEYGSLPKIITSSAKPSSQRVTFRELRAELRVSREPHLLLLGTGWGLGQEFFSRADYHLEPIEGVAEYNHLSVRSAAAIMLDRLFGQPI